MLRLATNLTHSMIFYLYVAAHKRAGDFKLDVCVKQMPSWLQKNQINVWVAKNIKNQAFWKYC